MLGALRAGWRVPLAAAALCTAFAAGLVELSPIEHQTYARIELAAGPIEMPRRTELRLLAIAREREPQVRVEVEVGIDDHSHRMPVLDVWFRADDPAGLREAAYEIIEETLAPHPVFHVHRLPLWQEQLRLLNRYLATHPPPTGEGSVKIEGLLALTKAVVESPPSRVTIGPTEVRPPERHLPLRLAGAACFGLLLGGSIVFLRSQPLDPIGRATIEVLRRRIGLLIAGLAIGAIAGAIIGNASPERPKIRALIEPAALDHIVVVTRTDELAEIVAREFPGLTIRWVHDLSPVRNRANLLEVIAENERDIDRVLEFVRRRQDPGLPEVIQSNAEKITSIDRDLPSTNDAYQFARHLPGITYALERDGLGQTTHLFCPPWREAPKSNVRFYAALGASLGLVLASVVARRGIRAALRSGR